MNTVVRLQVAMALRVRDFLRAHPFGEPKADRLAERFAETATRALGLQVEQSDGVTAAQGARSLRDSIGAKIRRVHLKFLTTVSRAASRENPELAAEFRVPSGRPTLQEFRATVQLLLDRAREREALFREYGLSETALADFAALLVAYDQAAADTNAGRRTHTGARRELAVLAADLGRQAKVLDVLMQGQIERDPKLAGAWASARNVAWPVRDGLAAEPKKDAA